MTDVPSSPRPLPFAIPTVRSVFDTLRSGDVALATGVMGIIVVLILPLPPLLLDALLAISIVFSVLILMTALFIQKPLEFSSFPTVLLIATMLRLALNLATTRLILADGHNGTDAAGHVIEAFGNFIMRGNFVIGVVVFAILIIVNFIVITKGSGRIAEVAARFNLDAMPGKQMAIDADLSAPASSTKTPPSKRRAELEGESAFFGNMDGASKFVRGDAIAGLLITFINIIAGMIIGVMQEGLTFQEAGQRLHAADHRRRPRLPDPGADRLDRRRHPGLQVRRHRLAPTRRWSAQFTGYPKALGMSLGRHGRAGLPARHAVHSLPRARRRRRLPRLALRPPTRPPTSAEAAVGADAAEAAPRAPPAPRREARSPTASRSTSSSSNSAMACSAWSRKTRAAATA